MHNKLPKLVSPTSFVGKIAQFVVFVTHLNKILRYFVYKYGFSPESLICVGSGDNPQVYK